MNQNTPPALRRRIPKVKDLAPLMQFKKVDFSTTARLKRANTISDLRTIAKRRTPQAPFDYTDGAAEAEITLNRARQAFMDLEFRPGILRNVESVDLSTDVLGRTAAMPFGIAPTGFTRMMQSEGEYAGSRAAEAAGIPGEFNRSSQQLDTESCGGKTKEALGSWRPGSAASVAYATSDQGVARNQRNDRPD